MMCPSLTSSRIDIRIQHETQNLHLSLSLSLFLPISSFKRFPFISPVILWLFILCSYDMMNRSHGDLTPSSSNPFEDPKVKLRHHSLMQDYQELHMETEAKRKKLQAKRERKATLVAEVRFLRRRYRHLRQDQPIMQSPDLKKIRGRSNGGKKIKTHIRVEVSPSKMSDAETMNVWIPDLNHSGSAHDETKTSLQRKVPLFDLNQILSGEEEEERAVSNDNEKMNVEESSSNKRLNSGFEMQQLKEMKLTSCRDDRDGSNKRKISWQDLTAALV